MHRVFNLRTFPAALLGLYLPHHYFNLQSSHQYPANLPIEDKIMISKIQDLHVYSIFDGHGGWQLSTYLSENMATVMKQKYQKDVENMLIDTFDTLEFNFKNFALEAQNFNFDISRVGSCALVAVVKGKELFVANSGDSKGVIIGENVYKVNKKLNAGSKKEQKRLREAFPNDENIVRCKREKCCYVKGALQPTRAFGDLRLKSEEFNLGRIKNFNGPYITHQPEIRKFHLGEKDRFLVLGSDGLWDEIKENDIQTLMQGMNDDFSVDELKDSIFQLARDKILERLEMNEQQFKEIPQGSTRRKKHDDISIVVVDLKKLS